MSMYLCALLVVAVLLPTACLAATAGTATSHGRIATLQNSPSGLFFYPTQNLLYVLSGVRTNGDHYLYAYTTSGTQGCAITIPSSVGMARVDGFYIAYDSTTGTEKAYIVDSQGPIHSSSQGGSIYVVPWTNPCGCDAGATASCTSTTATWSPTISTKIVLAADAASIGDGGGNDNYFRNSGIVIKGSEYYAVNGVHPNPSLTCCYPKSLIKGSLSTTGSGVATSKWSFTASTLGRDVDMEGLTCGADNCTTHIYIGDEYNYVYKLRLSVSDPATAVESEWNLNSIVGTQPDDKGIEAITYSPTTGHFYVGIQQTGEVYAVALTDASTTSTTPSPPATTTTTSPMTTATGTTTPSPIISTSSPDTTTTTGTALCSTLLVLVAALLGLALL